MHDRTMNDLSMQETYVLFKLPGITKRRSNSNNQVVPSQSSYV